MCIQDKGNINIIVKNDGVINLATDNARINSVQNNVEDDKGLIDEIKRTIQEILQKQAADKEAKILTNEDMECFSEEQIEFYKDQLGNRLNGTESKLEILAMFLHEMEFTLHSDKRYNCMPIFAQIPRKIVGAYVYLDNSIMPLDKAEVEEYYIDSSEEYFIKNNYFFLQLMFYRNTLVYAGFGYSLNYSDVNARMLGFRSAKSVVSAKQLRVHLIDENRDIMLNMSFFKESLKKLQRKTDFWIRQMEKIFSIERYFSIKFHLPKTADANDYIAIETIYNSITKKKCLTFGLLNCNKELIKKSINIKKEHMLNNVNNIKIINLFGYTFKPIVAYIMKCKLFYKKKMHAWGTDQGGIPIRVEYVVENIMGIK